MAATLHQPMVLRLLLRSLIPLNEVPVRYKMNLGNTTHDRWGVRRKKEVVFRNMVEDLDKVSLGEVKGVQVDMNAIKDGRISEEYLADQFIKQNIFSAKINRGSIYQHLTDAERTLKGKEPSKMKYLWKKQSAEPSISEEIPEPQREEATSEPTKSEETTVRRNESSPEPCKMESFPESPQAAKTNLFTFLEQRDMFRREQVIDIPDFCVGSIIAVTRSDRFMPRGNTHFVGICTEMDTFQNRLYATFTLRNVIIGEPMEIVIHKYSPLILKIEVLRHQTWKGHQDDLTMLRDYPPRFSTFAENMAAEPNYSFLEPFIFEPNDADRAELKAWFDADFERRRKIGAPYMRREDNHPWGKYKTHRLKYKNINRRYFP